MIQCHQIIGKCNSSLIIYVKYSLEFIYFLSNPSITYAPGLSIDVPKVPRGQGHPLQSFSVPGPPPSSLNTTPLISNPNKHSSKLA